MRQLAVASAVQLMNQTDDTSIATRASLLERLKNLDDQAGWQRFFDTYWRLIYGVALKTGLTHAEAQDVVQETVISVAKHLPGFGTIPRSARSRRGCSG